MPKNEEKEIITVEEPALTRLKRSWIRKCDYEVLAMTGNVKSLDKPHTLFTPADGITFGGSATKNITVKLGSQSKKSSKTDTVKPYYVANHNRHEYFVLEYFQRFGIVTPKARFIDAEHKGERGPIATKSIAGYIPMVAVRHDIPLEGDALNDKNLVALRERYKIDIESQLITDLKENKQYKISGNLFGTDVATTLVNDKDLGPDSYNLGLVRRGDRFYAAAIDKDVDCFAGLPYRTLEAHVSTVLEDELFQSKTREQTIAIVYEIYQAYLKGDFDKITTNERVKATKMIAGECEVLCENIKASALSLLAHFRKEYGRNFIQEYEEHEASRNAIADKVIEQLEPYLSESINQHDLRCDIIEDLRGPYYQKLFARDDIT